MTTKDIIKNLPLEDKTKNTLLEKFDTFTPDQKFDLEQVMWDAYEAIYNLKLQENLDLALLEAKENKESLDPEFYARVKVQTEKEMAKYLLGSTTEAELKNIRQKIQSLINRN
ncbi:hypothetical protein GYA28_03400 [Candidatus Roizmanbacteria bacterium]|jgi:hypothetical protein|nr:hypothetical protein [Candidatus Roizmanbacteria bacterium]